MKATQATSSCGQELDDTCKDLAHSRCLGDQSFHHYPVNGKNFLPFAQCAEHLLCANSKFTSC
jgi:hypothetical protein